MKDIRMEDKREIRFRNGGIAVKRLITCVIRLHSVYLELRGAGQPSRKVEKRGALAKNITQGFGVLGRVERFDRRGTEPFEPFELFEPFEFFQNRNFFRETSKISEIFNIF